MDELTLLRAIAEAAARHLELDDSAVWSSPDHCQAETDLRAALKAWREATHPNSEDPK